jgi:hypothetical protein
MTCEKKFWLIRAGLLGDAPERLVIGCAGDLPVLTRNECDRLYLVAVQIIDVGRRRALQLNCGEAARSV